MIVAAVLLGLASAMCFGLGSALEQRAAKLERPTRTWDPRLLLRLARRPMWLLGWVPDLAGTVLQAVALQFGPLSLVEPLLVSGMFMAVPLAAALSRRRLRVRDFVVVAAGLAGLAAFLAAAAPSGGVRQPPSLAWLPVGLVIVPLVAVLLVAAWRARGATRGVLLGVATGLLYGVAAALLKTVAATLARNPADLVTNWHLYAFVIVGVAAVVLNQNAFQSGPIAAPLIAITLFDPVTAVGIGVTTFDEQISLSGPRLAVGLVAVGLMAGGIWLAGTGREEASTAGRRRHRTDDAGYSAP